MNTWQFLHALTHEGKWDSPRNQSHKSTRAEEKRIRENTRDICYACGSPNGCHCSPIESMEDDTDGTTYPL